MAIRVPDLTGGGDDGGSRSGVTGSPSTGGAPSGPAPPSAVAAAQPDSPQKSLQTRWRPESFLNFHDLMTRPTTAPQASRTLDRAIQQAYQNDSQLENMIACTQFGQTVVTGSQKSIPTGLLTVAQVTAVIDNGATAHNFWVSATISQQPGCVDLYVWMPTAAGNNTPIAATTAVTVRWSVRGTLS